MLNGFKIKCEKCNNNAVEVKATSNKTYGLDIGCIRVKFVCIECGYEAEVPIVQRKIKHKGFML